MRTSKTHAIELKVFAETNQVKKLRDEFGTVQSEIGRVNAMVEKLALKQDNILSMARSQKRYAKAVNETSFAYSKLKTVALSALSALGIREISRLADSYTNISNKIRLVTDSEKELIDTRRKLLALSNGARVDLEDTADLYRRVKQSTEELNYSQKDMLEVTEAISKSITISGGSAESAKAALLQLSQGFASGTLRGQELNSVMEQAPRLARAIADGMGIAYGDLRKVAEQGGLTTAAVIEAIRKEGASIDEEFAKVNASISGSFTVLRNSSVELIGTLDQQIGASKTFTSAILGASKAMVEHKEVIASVAKQMAILGVAVASVKLGGFVLAAARANATLSLLRIGSIGASIALSRLGLSLKRIVATNAPLLALVAAFEAWNYITGKEADAQERLNSILNENYSVLSKMKRIQAEDRINVLRERLQTIREETQELYTQIKIEEGRSHTRTTESIALRAQLEKNKEITSEIGTQIDALTHVVNGTYDAEHGFSAAASAADGVASAVSGINAELKKTVSSAFELTRTMIQIDLEKGKITKKTAASQSYELAKERVSLITDPLKKEVELKKAELDFIREQKRIEAEIERERKRSAAAHSRRYKHAATVAKKAASAAKKAAREQARAAQKALQLRKEYYRLIGEKEKVFGIEATEKLKEMMKSGVFSQAEMSKAYNAMWDDFTKKGEKSAKSVADKLQEALGIKNDSVFGDLFKSIQDGIDGLFSSLREGKGINETLAGADIGHTVLSTLRNSGDPMLSSAGYGLELIGALFSSSVSQAEIDAATGRVDFTDESLSKMGDTFKTAMNPQLEATNKMSKYLRNMQQDFSLVARAITGVSGTNIDLTGANYVPTEKYGTLGFSSKKISLLGTGLDISGTLGDIDIEGYISQLIKKSSWWGLKKSTRVNIKYIDLPQSTQDALNGAVSDGIAQIVTASAALGVSDVEESIKKYEIDIGKVNFKGLTDEEVQKKLENVFSEIFSGAIGQVDSINALVQEYAKGGERNLETLTRIATEYEQASYALRNISVELLNQANGYTAQMQALDIVRASGGLQAFNDAYTSFVENFYTDIEKLKLQSKSLREQFAQLGLEMPKNNDQFRQLIETYPHATKEQNETYASLLKLSDAYAKMSTAQEQAAQAAYDAQKEYTDKIFELYTGEYSPLNMAQKELLYTQRTRTASSKSFEEYAKANLEYSFANATSQQDYRSQFNSYLSALKTNQPKATMDDIDKRLEEQNRLQSEQNGKTDEQLKIALKMLRAQQETIDRLDQELANKRDAS